MNAAIQPAEFGFTLDVAALPTNAKCERYFAPDTNGLTQAWHGRAWMNSPYFQGRDAIWTAKALAEVDAGNVEIVVALLNATKSSSHWWHERVMRAAELRYLEGRLEGYGKSVVAVFRKHRRPAPLLRTYPAHP